MQFECTRALYGARIGMCQFKNQGAENSCSGWCTHPHSFHSATVIHAACHLWHLAAITVQQRATHALLSPLAQVLPGITFKEYYTPPHVKHCYTQRPCMGFPCLQLALCCGQCALWHALLQYDTALQRPHAFTSPPPSASPAPQHTQASLAPATGPPLSPPTAAGPLTP
jgi:hypothetical protein